MRERRWILAALRRATVFGVVWVALAEADPTGWPVALATIVLATAVSMSLVPPPRWRIRWLATPTLAALFARQAFMGGVDVAQRALGRRMDLEPAFLQHAFGIRPGAPQLLMAWIVSLLPGTVSVQIRETELLFHALDTEMPVVEMLAELERTIDAVFAWPDD